MTAKRHKKKPMDNTDNIMGTKCRLRIRQLFLGAAAVLSSVSAYTQVTLAADGPGSTYELISSVLGGYPIEVPDCSHPEFGRHITEAWDDILGKYVFVFHIHVTPDNDRCVNFDRQRNEIKTYGPSPAYLKGYYNDIHTYRWKFKLDAGFQPSPNFTHIFQIKAGDGSDSDAPIITLTPRYGTPQTMQLIFTPSSGSSGGGTKDNPPLEPFKGEWVEAYVRTLYAENGTIDVVLTRIRDGAILMSYTNNNLDMWRGDATFNRPKWGIYRSLNSSQYLRDEEVRFADFCIAKGSDTCPCDERFFPIDPETPFDQEPASGGDIFFEVIPVGGVTILNYQWFEVAGSEDVPVGTNSPMLIIPAAGYSDTGRKFYCRITADKGTFFSRTAQIRSLETALILHLAFDDGTANDSSGSGNHGILNGDLTFVQDPQRGRVINFDGVNGSYIRIPNSPSLNAAAEQITIAMWLYTDTTAVRQLTEKGGTGGSAWYIPPWGIRMESDRTLRLNWGNGLPNPPGPLYSSAIEANRWTHVAMTYDSTLPFNHRKFYINGVLDAASDWTGGAAANTNDLFIGTDFYNNTSRWAYLGRLDDIRIYNTALCAGQIRRIMTGGPHGDIDGDGRVTLADFAYVSAQWLLDGAVVLSADIWPGCGDGRVNIGDLMLMASHYMESK